MTTADRLNSMALGEAMFTQRAIRRFKKDPIPEEVMNDIMESAIRAPNGGNNQQWHFIVVQDAAGRGKLAELYTRPGGPSGPTPGYTDRKTSLRAGTPCARRCGWPTRLGTHR